MKIVIKTHRIYWYLIAILPLVWFIGGEQFGLPIVVLLLLLRRIVFKKGVYLSNASLVIWIFWLVSMMLSIGMIDDSLRYVTWFRNFSVACSGFAMAYLVYESHSQIDWIKGFLLVVLFYATCCAVTGLLGVMGVDFTYFSPIAKLLKVQDAGYLHDIFTRSFVQADADWFDEGFIRPKGMLLFANLLSGLVLVGSAIKVYFLAARKNSWIVTLLLLAFLLLDGTVVIATLSRSAWIGLAVSFSAVLFFARLSTGAKLGLLVMFLVVNILAFALGLDDLIEKRFTSKAISNDERATNYRLIGQGVMKDPLHFMFGYGSQRTTWQINIPIGSHSTYLGMMYKYGFVGLSLFTTGVALLLLRLRKAIQRDKKDRYLGALLMSSLLQIAIQALFIEIDVDVVYMMVWWILVGLSMAYSDLVIGKAKRNMVLLRRSQFA